MSVAALSSGGALVAQPWLRFHTPLIEPDVQISRIRLSDKTSRSLSRATPSGASAPLDHVMTSANLNSKCKSLDPHQCASIDKSYVATFFPDGARHAGQSH